MRKILGRNGGISEQDRPRPSMDGVKSGAGGVKVTSSTVALDLPCRPGRYAFRVEGSAPSGLHLGDLTDLLEARFQGDPKFNLSRTRDEAVQRLKERMEKRLEKLRLAEEKAEAHARDLEEQREKYEATREEIAAEALGDLDVRRKGIQADIDAAEREASRLRGQITALRGELDDTRTEVADLEAKQDRTLARMSVDAMDEPWMPMAQADGMAEDLIHAWRSTLQDYDAMPLSSEFDDLAGMLSKLLVKTIGRVNDRWRISGKVDPGAAVPVVPDGVVKKTSGGSLF